MKKGKTLKLDIFNDSKCYYGSVDTTNLKSIYLVLQTWVIPTVEKEKWDSTVGIISRAIKHKILEIYDKDIFKEHFIVDMDLRTSGIKLTKASFLNLEITFFINGINDFKSNEIRESLKDVIQQIHNDILLNSKHFKIQYSKTSRTRMKV
jgi:hypothetical protein